MRVVRAVGRRESSRLCIAVIDRKCTGAGLVSFWCNVEHLGG